MPTTPSDPVSSPGQDAPKDPVDLLVKALAAVPEADRDLVTHGCCGVAPNRAR